jgi:diguanylate cyclase (GGDEF)-like protein
VTRSVSALYLWAGVTLAWLVAGAAFFGVQPEGAVHAAGWSGLVVVALVPLVRPFRAASFLVTTAVAILLLGLMTLPALARDTMSGERLVAACLAVLVVLTAALLSRRLDAAIGGMIGAFGIQQATIEELTIHDAITGALTPRFGTRVLEEELARARRYERPLSVVALEPLDWEQALDGRADAEADARLRAIAGELLRSVRVMDRVARSGGVEFLLILPETPMAGAEIFTERLVVSVATTTAVELRAGVASYPDDADTVEDLVAEARGAMVFARSAGLPFASRSLFAR